MAIKEEWNWLSMFLNRIRRNSMNDKRAPDCQFATSQLHMRADSCSRLEQEEIPQNLVALALALVALHTLGRVFRTLLLRLVAVVPSVTL